MGILLGFIGISILIFVHELGHFLTAKWAGAKVQTFSLGFDPTIKGVRLKLFSWQWGETEYVIGLIPFGGYVRPAESEDNKKGEFTSQPPLRRALIFAAGAGMNLLFGFVAFFFAFSIGVSFLAPEAGSIIPGSPAWKAGIKPGDKFVSIDNKSVESFMDIAVATVLGGCRERTITIDRNGEKKTFHVTPTINNDIGMPSLGIGQTISRTISTVFPDSAAEKYGIKEGDEILSIVFSPDDKKIVLDSSLPASSFIHEFVQLSYNNPGGQFLIKVKDRQGNIRDINIIAKKDSKNTVPRLGIKQSANCVLFVRPDTKASSFFTPGVVVESINNKKILFITPNEIANQFNKDTSQLTFKLSNGKEHTIGRDEFFSWCFMEDIIFGAPNTVVLSVGKNSPAEKAGLQSGDRITRINGIPLGTRESLTDFAKEKTIKISFERNGKISSTSLAWKQKLGIKWSDSPILAAPQKGSPAEKAGIQQGARLISMEGKKIQSWLDVIKTVHDNQKSSIKLKVLQKGKERVFSIIPMQFAPGSIGIGFHEARIIIKEKNLWGALKLGTKRTIASIRMIFFTLLRIFSGDVAAKNLQGPIGIIHITSVVTHYGFGTLLFFLALISVNLGVLNLLPIPIFDGGHLLLLLIEVIKGSPVNEKAVQTIVTVMFFLLIALAVFVTYHDILRIIP